MTGFGSFTMKLSLHGEQGMRQLAAVGPGGAEGDPTEIDRLAEVVPEEGAVSRERSALLRLRRTTPPLEHAGRPRHASS